MIYAKCEHEALCETYFPQLSVINHLRIEGWSKRKGSLWKQTLLIKSDRLNLIIKLKHKVMEVQAKWLKCPLCYTDYQYKNIYFVSTDLSLRTMGFELYHLPWWPSLVTELHHHHVLHGHLWTLVDTEKSSIPLLDQICSHPPEKKRNYNNWNSIFPHLFEHSHFLRFICTAILKDTMSSMYPVLTHCSVFPMPVLSWSRLEL